MLPTLQVEYQIFSQGFHLVAGVDEAGRGCWAGPVVAGAVILPPPDQADIFEPLHRVRDSKLLTAQQRADCEKSIRAVAVACGVGQAEAEEIDRWGIVPATRAAMQRAIAALWPQPEALLIDALALPDLGLAQTVLNQADRRCLSVACASIIAKVARDRLMLELDRAYPGYAFAQHKGYGTPQHRAALDRLGPSPIHRRSFAPVRRWLNMPVGD